MKRKVLVIMSMVALMAGAVGCSSNSEPAAAPSGAASSEAGDTGGGTAGETYKIGMVTYQMSQEWYQNILAGAKEEAEKQGVEFLTADGQNDAAKQVEAVENMIVQGVDALIISPVDVMALAPVVKQAQDQGIKVICESNMVEGADAKVGISDREAGKTAGTWFAEYAKANNIEPKVLLLGYESLANCKNRSEGFKEGMTEAGITFEIKSEVDGGFREQSMNAAIDAFTANPDINMVFGINDDSTLGAISAIKQLGLEKNGIATMLFGAEGAAGRDALKNETLVTAALCQFPEYIGSITIQAAVDELNGEAQAEYLSPTVVVEKAEFDTYFNDENGTYSLNLDAVKNLVSE